MGATTIEWADYTFNPWRGCSKVSPGCEHCYAERESRINPAVLGEWGPEGKRAMAAESYWRLPEKWNRRAIAWPLHVALCEKQGIADPILEWQRRAGELPDTAFMRRPRVFVGSMMDVFEDRHELRGPRERLFATIARTPRLDWLLLTKRPAEARRVLFSTVFWNNVAVHSGYRQGSISIPTVLPNLWLGVSVENQATANDRIPLLLTIPAAVRFLSCEPLLGPVDLTAVQQTVAGCFGDCLLNAGIPYPTVNWVIAGGESGPEARPMHPDWVRSLRDQCLAADVPFFFKQWGAYAPISALTDKDVLLRKVNAESRGIPYGHRPNGKDDMFRVGKKAAGRLLDGREWNEFPQAKGVER